MASSAASSHVNALQSKHAGLEARLRDEMARPVPDAAAMTADIKRMVRGMGADAVGCAGLRRLCCKAGFAFVRLIA